MSVTQIRTTIDEVGESCEVSILPGDALEPHVLVVESPQAAAMLAVTVTDVGPEGHRKGPFNLQVRIIDPDGRDLAENAFRAEEGQIVLVVEDPMPGRWTIVAECKSDSSGEINVGLLRCGWLEKVRGMGHWLRCKTCKVALRALIIALVVHLLPLVAGGFAAHQIAAVLKQIPGAILSALQQTLSLSDDGLPHFLSVFGEYVSGPIDRALQRACAWLGLCESTAVEAAEGRG